MLGPELGEEGDRQPADALALILVGDREPREQQLQRPLKLACVDRGEDVGLLAFDAELLEWRPARSLGRGRSRSRAAAAAGVLAGRRLSHRLPARTLTHGFAVVLLAVAVVVSVESAAALW